MKKTIIVLMLMMCGIYFSNAQTSAKKTGTSSAYNAGIGVHLGEPFAISYKKNMDKTAWEVSIGLTRRSFGYNDNAYLSSRPRFDGYTIQGSSFGICTVVQFHYLFQYDIKPVEGLKFYWGLGPQFRFRPYTVDVRDNLFPSIKTSRAGIDIDLGLDLVFGAEYKFKNLPLAVFADITPFTEFVDRFYVYPMGGVGGRFTF